MELHIRREQKSKKGMLSSGPLEFILHAQLMLNNEEAILVERYKGCLPALYINDLIDNDERGKKYYNITDFINGVMFTNTRIAVISNLEKDLKKIPDMLKTHFKLAKEFGDEEIIKFDIT